MSIFQLSSKQMHVKIVSYNIWGMPWGTQSIHEILMWLFCQSGGEIICLQEVFSKWHRQVIGEKARVAGWQLFYPSDSCWVGKCLNAFHSGSGLCILVHPKIHVLNEIPFVPFTYVDSIIESLVRKGYFGLQMKKNGIPFSLFNTHMIADMTECSPLRIAHGHGRRFQEKQLMESAMNIKGSLLIVGDLNQEEQHYLHRMYPHEDWTFPTTQEQLDHVVCLIRDKNCFQVKKVNFFQDIRFSDHIPIRVDVHIKSKDKPD